MRMPATLAAALLGLAAQFATAPALAQDIPMVQGEITKIDSSQKKLTIRHGAIPHIGMNQPMMMVFKVADPAMIDTVAVGDHIQFRADRIRGDLTVIEIEKE
ncbi:copper-binding protein [Microbaculum sp. FT89]|uniref:copper-binding protein n=1 Tax=Microbaculum sp. FT89 TaxID=3447298 RepID=UPI003F53E26D